MAFILSGLQVLQTSSTGSEGVGPMIGWVCAFVIAAWVCYMVAQPLLKLETGKKRVRMRQLSDAQVELETLQEKTAAERQSLEELEFDRELGIIEDSDYALLKERTRTRLSALEKAVFERQEEIAEAERDRREQLARRKARKAQANNGVAENGKAAPETAQATAPRPAATASPERITGEFKLKAFVREALKCSECATPFKPGETFCSQCKAPLPLICLNCGAELQEDAHFCSRCGTAVVR